MGRDKIKGILCGIFSAVSFGTNPLFGLPLYQRGMSTQNVLFYRFVFAVLMLGGVMLLRHQSFRLSRKQVLPALFSGLLLAFTCLFLFLSFWLLDAGIASTVLFVYPLMVALIMRVFFHEKLCLAMGIGMFLSLAGIALLYQGGSEVKFSLTGLIYVLLSALIYAIYMVNVNQSSLKELPSETLTFYSMLFGLPVFFISLRCGLDLRLPPDLFSWGCVFGLAFFPALLSFLLLAVSIQQIGATATAVIGALEPATAILIGVMVFGETLTLRIIIGIVLIMVSVILAAAGRKISFPGWNGKRETD